MRLFDDAPAAAEQFVERTSGTYREARARRQAGDLYMLVPHWGTRLRYRVRAEVPGVFHALPAVLYGMYVPELRGNSDELVVGIEDKNR